MKALTKLKYMMNAAVKSKYIIELLENPTYENERICAEIIRNVHSIEKGLSLRNVRSCFGYNKIMEASNLVERLFVVNKNKYNEIIMMFIHALKAYLKYHEQINVIDEKLTRIKAAYDKLIKLADFDMLDNDVFGGYIQIKAKKYLDSDYEVIKRLFYDRHSVREFSKEPVDLNSLNEAIALAHRCPSACNRQGYRVHVVCKEKIAIFKDWLEGVGGFIDEIDKMILITGKISTYRNSEELQYIVSASVFAGFLTLALQAKNIGSCFIQRSVLYTKKWGSISRQLGIPIDEQIICALGLGNYMDEYKVPISHRLSIDQIMTIHN